MLLHAVITAALVGIAAPALAEPENNSLAELQEGRLPGCEL
jgi:hypothetical protein